MVVNTHYTNKIVVLLHSYFVLENVKKYYTKSIAIINCREQAQMVMYPLRNVVD